MARGILDALMANPRGWGMTGLASPEEGVSVPQDPMSPGEAAMKLVQRRVPQEVTPLNVAKIGAASVLGPAMEAGLGLAAGVPRITQALLGLTHPLPAGSEDSDRQGVMNLQRQLKEAGYYTGPIDGLMQGGTKDAKARFEADQAQRQQLEIERAKAQAAGQAAEAAQAETARKAAEAEAATQRRTQGEERLRQMEGEVPWYRQMLREYAPIAGTMAGIGLGFGAKRGVNKIADALSSKGATAADDIMAGPAADLPGRVARVNQFWAQGQKPLMGGPQAPFVSAPNTKAGFRSNPQAPEASDLYQPSRVRNALTDAGATGAFGAEWALGQGVIEPEARAELEKAQEAVNTDPSEVNIARLQAAKDRVAFAEAFKNIGRGATFAYPATGIKYGRSPTRPNVSAAEAERLRIGQEVKGRSPVAEALMAPAKKTGRMKTVAPGVRRSQGGTYHADDGKFVSPPTKK